MKLLSIILISLMSYANAAEIYTLDDPDVVYITGDISRFDRFEIRDHLKDNLTIIVNSRGGNAQSGLSMYYKISQFNNITIIVDEKCNSACSTFALAADKLIGTLGFHEAFIDPRWSYGKPPELVALDLNSMRQDMEAVWRKHLTDEQVNNIKTKSSRDKMYYVRFK